jgi:transaldolase/glucose-6-phosphate isomerase
MTSLTEIYSLGQSLWYDNIQRSMLKNGTLAGLISMGAIRGVTSNPSIFHNAIVNTKDYDSSIRTMAWGGLDAEEIFWELAVKDIQDAADLFLPVYKETKSRDGYISLEVNPFLARDTDGTVREAIILWSKVNRPNLMIKIPATREGIPAIRQSIAQGINVNVTLIFSLKRYEAVIDAFMSGLEDRVASNKDITQIASVASFFVSRVDTKVDGSLTNLIKTGVLTQVKSSELFGKAAIANAKLAYQLFKQKFGCERFLKLIQNGAQLQRPLWASTSTKNPSYRDVMYVEGLIGENTVNTVPPATLTAFIEHGNAALTIESNLDQAAEILQKLESINISMRTVTEELEKEGVKAFADAFQSLLQSIEERKKAYQRDLGSLSPAVKKRIEDLNRKNVVQRLFDHDPGLWTTDPVGQAEIRERMDWLMAPWQSEELLPQLRNLLQECRDAGFTRALLLGMGGSSLAPEVLSLINGFTNYHGQQGLELGTLDSTNPEEVFLAAEHFPVAKTLFIVSSKSGTTGEINAFYQYFWKLTSKFNPTEAGKHFIALTDPGTKLDSLARENKFWKIFHANPRVGGRNSALTAFGLVPAELIGIDPDIFLKKTQEMAQLCLPSGLIFSNPGVVLGAILAESVFAGRDKLTTICDTAWWSFGNWLEQLVAESSGKDGKGIIPIVNEPLVSSEKYGKDRLFVYIRDDGANDHFINEIKQLGHPVVVLDALSKMDLGGQFYQWEIAVAIACSILCVNSFDQPDVQDAKTRTLVSIAQYKLTGKLDQGMPTKKLVGGEIYTNQDLSIKDDTTLSDALELFLEKYLKLGDYVALNAFLPRIDSIEKELQLLRKQIIERFGNATTLGFGPRFLHSTGQLHKGGPNSGVFIEITADSSRQIEIPGEGLTFGTMTLAQAVGDFQALESKNRRLIRIHLHNSFPAVLLQ